ncbi:phage terminase large subunit [Pendulispora brunnea]|uniref:Phage terminase large subunit n=1 Tax=Pendulispora brunnea TaxID=2905690 RepID=A0ABZ2K900_9BACT
MSDEQPTWRPIPGPQTRFLSSAAYEVLFGGAAGGSKTEALLVAPLRWVSEPSFRGLLLRRTFPELERSLIDRSRQLYPLAFPSAKYREDKRYWAFPSGARIAFGHLEHEHDVYSYQSSEWQFLGFDELTLFSERQYVYMLSRARSSKGLPIRVRAATNPGGSGHEWVFRRWGPWLDPKCTVHAGAGETLHYRNTDDGEQWCTRESPGALSRVFIPSKVSDNPYLSNTDYIERLKGLDPLTRAQLLDGNWLARPAKGLLFKRAWLPIIDLAPAAAFRVRYWDRAASAGKGDWTVGIRVARADGLFIVEDVVRLRGTPREVQATILGTAELDGRATMIGIEQDPGSAGVFEADSYVRLLAGHNVRKFRVSKDKVVRAQPVSAQAEGGNVRLLRGAWNEAFVQELEAFPEGNFDDQVDSFSGAFSALTTAIAPAIDPRFRRYAPHTRM